MIKFFRRIRQKLLTENRFSKYLLYGLGEITLVVIGILIALQINNWNEQRKQNNLEQDYLIALKIEFENNLKEVNRVIKLNTELLEKARELATYTGPNAPNITEKKFGELFFGVIGADVQYSPGSGVINEIINSGKLNIFQNKDLKNALATLDGLHLKVRFQENEELEIARKELILLGQENLSLRKMAYDSYGGMFGLDEGKFLDSNLHVHLLTSRKFDNRLFGFILTAGPLKGRYEGLKNQIEEIIKIIDAQIK